MSTVKSCYKDYCVGCGLCEAVKMAICNEDEKGFMHPIQGDNHWFKKVCPCGGYQEKFLNPNKIWGNAEEIFYGWSKDVSVRNTASSGGIITETAAWLLEKGKVDAVIHTCVHPQKPMETITCISTSRDELIERSGSRYTISHPLEVFDELDKGKKYAFIGKPCDVAALRNYMDKEPDVRNYICYTLSFFCAGLPSRDAQDKLLNYLECKKENVVSMRYRGDGWPGYTTVLTNDMKEHKTDYATSWGKILGRDIMKACRFCMDGIGETADISCGDAWYMDGTNKPVFSEGDGRNVIFARSKKGLEILEEMIENNRIEVKKASSDELRYIQAYQWDRRATMIDKILALKVAGKSTPEYSVKAMIGYSKDVSVTKHLRIFAGTLKRIGKGKI